MESNQIETIEIDGKKIDVVKDFHFRTPTIINLCGTSHSGKTEFILKLIENQERLFIPNVKRVVFVYAENQPSLFERVRKAYPETVFIEGLNELQSKVEFTSSIPTLLVLDDIGHESGSSEYVLQLAVRESHHKNITVIYVQHNIYTQQKLC